jgi:lipopolysaccharide export system protein LptA
MKLFHFVCLVLGACYALKAQTNSGTLIISTNAPSVSQTNEPAEIRPTEIQSSSGQFFMKSNVFVYRGDVRVDNPEMKLRCELLTIEAPKLASGKFNRATAETNVVIDFVNGTPPNRTTNHATAEKAVYTSTVTNIAEPPALQWQTNSLIVLTGNPVVTNVQGTFQGDPIVMDRIADTITSPNFLHMTVNQSTSNSPSFFETPAPNSSQPHSRQK